MNIVIIVLINKKKWMFCCGGKKAEPEKKKPLEQKLPTFDGIQLNLGDNLKYEIVRGKW